MAQKKHSRNVRLTLRQQENENADQDVDDEEEDNDAEENDAEENEGEENEDNEENDDGDDESVAPADGRRRRSFAVSKQKKAFGKKTETLNKTKVYLDFRKLRIPLCLTRGRVKWMFF